MKNMIKYTCLKLIGVCYVFSLNAQSVSPKLVITPIAENFYVYTTYNTYKGVLFPANGLYVVTPEGVLIIDTPWDTTQFQTLLDSIAIKHQQKAVMCLSTHFHEDRTGGLTFFRQSGIATYTTAATDSISAYMGFPRAQFIMAHDTSFQLGNLVMETYYPGPGHTTDNIVCWFPEQRILYGGCLIKSTVDQSLGNTSDGDLKAYASSVKRVNRKYHKAKIIIPGHHDWTDTQSIKNTLKMAKAIKKSG